MRLLNCQRERKRCALGYLALASRQPRSSPLVFDNFPVFGLCLESFFELWVCVVLLC